MYVLLKSANLNITLPQEAHPVIPPKEREDRFLIWTRVSPALSLQFILVAMGAALRGLGDMKIPTMIQIATIVINIALAPVLIFGDILALLSKLGIDPRAPSVG